MAQEQAHETRTFQAEVQQLLDLMIHSLYSSKEIFLRELISNASDALDKLRFEALQDERLKGADVDLKIRVTVDPEAGTLTVTDNGIGMTRDEVIENIGTIAHSGTRDFIRSLTGDRQEDAKLIGQFGVGFYSAFIVADEVTVLSRRQDADASQAVMWRSRGDGQYELDTVRKEDQGTEVILNLRPEERELLNPERLKEIIRRYSDHIGFPIIMPDGEGGETVINTAKALWARPKADISDEEYAEFYKHVAHDFEPPLTWIHNRVEGRQSYISLLFVPSRAPFDLSDRERRHGVKLYVRRVFVKDEAEHLMPPYLRFVRGVIDSDDLPLNISREMLQASPLIETIRNASVKRVLEALHHLAQHQPEQYRTFWSEFGLVFKEGAVEDKANRDRIARLLRFYSTKSEPGVQDVSLEGYIERMQPGQEKIYYLTAETYDQAINSPLLEVFREQGIEVLLLTDRIDEWLVAHLSDFDEKPLQSVARGTLDLGHTAGADQKVTPDADESQNRLIERIRGVLGDVVKEVRLTRRLTQSPTCLVSDEYDISPHLERMLKAAGQNVPPRRPILELNPDHPLIQRLQNESDEERFRNLTAVLYDQAVLGEGGQVQDPAGFIQRLNDLLVELAERRN